MDGRFLQTLLVANLAPNSGLPDTAFKDLAGGQSTARSHHRRGCNALRADGSVRFVSDSIDVGLWRALGTRNGAEPVRGF